MREYDSFSIDSLEDLQKEMDKEQWEEWRIIGITVELKGQGWEHIVWLEREIAKKEVYHVQG